MSMQERPPLVRFETRAIEDRQASLASGRYMARDVNYVLVTPAGSKDVYIAVAEEWLAAKAEEARKERYPTEWVDAFRKAYATWKDGNELPENGTPIKGWPLLSPAKQEMYIRMNVRTVEDLAALNEEGIRNCGMGARTDKQTAENWILQAANGADAGKLSALQTENQRLTQQVSEMHSTINTLADQVQTLMQSQPRRGPGRPRKNMDDIDIPVLTESSE